MLMAEARREICAYGRRIAGLGMVVGASGNLSVREGELVAVTPSGFPLDRIEPEDCPVIDLTGRWVDGDVEPSSETPMHLGIYADTGAGAVVHTHSAHGTAVALTMTELPPIHYDILLLGGPVRVAEYATYGTAELAENVRTALAGRRAALIANHGGVTFGADLAAAFEAARLLEWLCEVYVRARAIGEPRVLSEAELAAVTRRRATPTRTAQDMTHSPIEPKSIT
ncbi:class II aldolase/adducin family protein [Spongiactinospora sp. TRM90649]|uniref:class II aldolase/adducin family protein n=1 Tax=Spongiactinospora sp. TRM90649 TaxID=3031114 RepID=UPI0023FA252E|nr:class II aldolase/adducin family protein [Spongiactinospora sp. TRM90649]MDF5757231.1 class II aldolase/adducin family protein [Spongiactinospora sp. TRM90649]